MNANIRLGKISSIDYAKGMARVVYHEKDDDVTRLIPLLSHEYKMPPVGALYQFIGSGRSLCSVVFRFGRKTCILC